MLLHLHIPMDLVNPSFQFIRELNLNSFFQGAKKVADKDAKFL